MDAFPFQLDVLVPDSGVCIYEFLPGAFRFSERTCFYGIQALSTIVILLCKCSGSFCA